MALHTVYTLDRISINVHFSVKAIGSFDIIDQPASYTAKTKCRKFETNIPRKGISGPQSQFPHSCV